MMRKTSTTLAIWLAPALLAVTMPWFFYDYGGGRHSGFILVMLTQIAIMSIFALSYNMMLGQAGLFSLCHATFFGFAGYCTAHILNYIGSSRIPIPIELIPLLSGFCAFGIAIVFGYMAAKQRAWAFAMITLGISELMVTAALIFQNFFGGESGVTTDRAVGASIFGLDYVRNIQLYYFVLGWAVISAIAMYFMTATPLGRMVNAVRDNFERTQFMGYDPSRIRFLQFVLSGFFAGIAGGLYAIVFEIVSFNALAFPLTSNALLMAYIGGSNAFGGPILGAVLITVLQTGVSQMSNSWLLYAGVLFIAMVLFAPAGLMGIVLAHGPVARAGGLGRLAWPYVRLFVPGLLAVLGFVGLVELASFLTIGAAQGRSLALFGRAIDVRAPLPWAISLICLTGGAFWLRAEVMSFRRIWAAIIASKPTASSVGEKLEQARHV